MPHLLVQYVAQQGWVDLPINPDMDISAWIEEKTKELVERNAEDGEQVSTRALSRDLKQQAEEGREREPQSSCALYGNGISSALAVLDIEVLDPSEEMPVLNLEQMSELLSTEELGAPKIQHPELSAGPAVRIRQNILGPRAWKLGPRSVIHTLTYCICPREFDQAVIMRISWTTPIIDDLVPEAADSIASSLVFTEVPE